MAKTDFEIFLDEFHESHQQMVANIGGLGLANIKESKENEDQQNELFSRKDGEDLYMNRGIQRDFFDRRDSSNAFDENTEYPVSLVSSVLEEIKAHTYSVNVENLFNDLTFPMFEKLDSLAYDQQLHESRMQLSNEIYLASILRAVRNTQNQGGGGLFDHIQSSFQTFMRAPLWNTLLGAMRGLNFGIRKLNDWILSPIFSGINSIIFGKKDDAIEKKILDAIKEQTDYMRTGETGGRSWWARFRDQGIVGMAGRSIAGDLVGGREVSQRRQEQREAGVEVTGGLKGWLADRLYLKDDVVKKTTQARKVETTQPFSPSMVVLDQKSIEDLTDVLDDTLAYSFSRLIREMNAYRGEIQYVKNDPQFNRFMEDSFKLTRDEPQNASVGLTDKTTQKQTYLAETLGATVEDKAVTISPSREFNDAIHPISTHVKETFEIQEQKKQQEEKFNKEGLANQAESLESSGEIERSTKNTADEVSGLRGQLLFGFLISGIGSAISLAVRTTTSLLQWGFNSVAGAIGALSAAILGAKFLNRNRPGGGSYGGGAGSGGRGSPATKGGRMSAAARSAGRIATPLAIASGLYSTYDVWTDPEASIGEKVTETSGIVGGTGGAIAGGKAGAALGSLLLPGVGTVAGGLIGSGLGYFAGSEMGKGLIGLIPGMGDDSAPDEKTQPKNLKELISQQNAANEPTSTPEQADDSTGGFLGKIFGWVKEVPDKVSEGVSSAMEEHSDKEDNKTPNILQTLFGAGAAATGRVIDYASSGYDSARDYASSQHAEMMLNRAGNTGSRVIDQGRSLVESGYESGSKVVESSTPYLTEKLTSTFESIKNVFSSPTSDVERVRQQRMESMTQQLTDLGSDSKNALTDIQAQTMNAIEMSGRHLNIQTRVQEATNKVAEGVGTSNVYLEKMTKLLEEMKSSNAQRQTEMADDNSGLMGGVRDFMSGGILSLGR